jgi:hypothetical protein
MKYYSYQSKMMPAVRTLLITMKMVIIIVVTLLLLLSGSSIALFTSFPEESERQKKNFLN